MKDRMQDAADEVIAEVHAKRARTMTPEPRDLTERRVEIAEMETRASAILSVLNDPIRKHWSLTSRLRYALEQYDPATAELVTLRLLAQNADSVMETNRVMGERLLEQKALLERAAGLLLKLDHDPKRYLLADDLQDEYQALYAELRARAG